MRSLKTYYSKSQHQYFTDEDNLLCEHCNSEIDDLMLHIFLYDKKESKEYFLCRNCWKEAKPKAAGMCEVKIIIISDIVPNDAVPYIFRPPNLVAARNIDVFKAAELGSDKTIDKAYQSKNPKFMIDPDYKEFDLKESLQELEDKSKPLSENEFFDKLNNIQNSTLIEEKETKRIGNK